MERTNCKQMKTLHLVETSCAASIAAYGEDSSLSAFTFIPPVFTEIRNDRLKHCKQDIKRGWIEPRTQYVCWNTLWNNVKRCCKCQVINRTLYIRAEGHKLSCCKCKLQRMSTIDNLTERIKLEYPIRNAEVVTCDTD